MKITETRMCINCEELVPLGAYAACPSCGSHVMMPLTTWVPSAAAIIDGIINRYRNAGECDETI